MIHSEKEILKSLTKLTKNTNDLIYCDQCNQKFTLVQDSNKQERYTLFTEKNIVAMLGLLADKGYITIHNHPTEIYLSLTIDAIYRFQFSFDRIRYAFFSKFLYGLISGIIIGIISTIIAEYLMIDLELKTTAAGCLMDLLSLNIWR